MVKRRWVPEPLLPKPFASWKERLCCYQSRSLESNIDWLNFQDALHDRGTLTERTSRLSGTTVKLG
jgi:hypothetical protein